jgi:hypothetical protein
MRTRGAGSYGIAVGIGARIVSLVGSDEVSPRVLDVKSSGHLRPSPNKPDTARKTLRAIKLSVEPR